jgi:hypothetical protein
MIGFFPEPFPDELFYSLCARYRRRANYRGRTSTVRDLFGLASFRAAVDLPSRLDHLVASFPPGHDYTSDRLIDEHTLLPFYAAFFPPERVTLVRTEMGRSPRRAMASVYAGGARFAMRLKYLRYCPLCVAEDRERCGEAYWHRVHQASGVQLCPSHGVTLEPSSVNAIYRVDREEFQTLEETLPMASARTPDRHDTNDRRSEFHLAIARDIRWLLDQRGLCAAPADLRRRYLNLLSDCGLATSTDLVRWRALRGEIERYYGGDFLASLNCRLEGHARPFAPLFQGEWHRASHPVHHLLLIHYLGCSARDFFMLPAEKRQPFGSPPWPCLNPASDHYRELRIHGCTVKDFKSRTKDPQRNSLRRIVGEFACDCGFVYRRIGPDASEEDRYRAGWVRGDREQAQLEQEEKRRTYQAQWLNAVRENPQIDLLTLKAKLPAAYNWFRRNEESWMRAHTPRHQKGPKIVDIDWEARDIELSTAVRRSAARLMNAPGRPVRVSAAAIAKDTENRCLVLSHDERLPLTNRALIEVAESAEEWAIRRVRWAVDCYRREGVCASRWSVVTRASVSAKLAARQGVLAVIEEGVRNLRLFSQQSG